MYWSPAQMLAHMTVNGASLRTGDLFASGTVSGPSRIKRLADRAGVGRAAAAEPARRQRRGWLEDGDEVVIRATAGGPDGTRVGFGDAHGQIMPAWPPGS